MSPNTNFPLNLDIAPSTHPLLKLADVFTYDAQRNAINQYGIAGRVWEAAYAMSFYVNPPPEHEFEPRFLNLPLPRTIIELGSGTGVVAATIANVLDRHEDLMIATDLQEVCPLLMDNLCVLSGCPVLVWPLPWGNASAGLRLASELFSGPSGRTLTHIVCSDLVYFPELLAPLLRTLLQLTSPPFVRDSVQPFDFRPVLVKCDPGLRGRGGDDNWQRFGADADDKMFIFAARRRVDSFAWKVPSDDQALLDGVNAWGSSEKKSDDAFESLLFMSFQAN